MCIRDRLEGLQQVATTVGASTRTSNPWPANSEPGIGRHLNLDRRNLQGLSVQNARKMGGDMAGTEDAQPNETPTGPLLHSFSELGRRLAGDDSVERDAEGIKLLVEDVLSDYADCDVYVEDLGEPDIFLLRVGTRGIGIPYPGR